MANSKKLIEMYEEYLRENLSRGSREEIIDQFISTVIGFMDFNNPEVYAQVVKILLRYEQGKMKKGAQPLQGDEEAELESDSGEELDFTGMYKPSSFNDLADHINVLSVSHANILEIEDVLNLASVVKSVRPYMFDIEAPWVGVINEVLCLSWTNTQGQEAVISFVEGMITLEFSHKDDYYEIMLDEEDKVEQEQLMRLIVEAHDVLQY